MEKQRTGLAEEAYENTPPTCQSLKGKSKAIKIMTACAQ
jgi:hypothetical protein